jgi:hypothetical protein
MENPERARSNIDATTGANQSCFLYDEPMTLP